MRAFIQQVYFVDVCAIGAMYADWFGYGEGVTNYLAVPDLPLDSEGDDLRPARRRDHERRTWPASRRSRTSSDEYFQKNVTECVAHSWYDGDWTRHPYEEETEPRPVHDYDARREVLVDQVAAVRRRGDAGGAAGAGAGRLRAVEHEPTMRWATKTLETAGKVAGTQLSPAILHSTLGRHAARMIRMRGHRRARAEAVGLLAENIGKGDTAHLQQARVPVGRAAGLRRSTRRRAGRCRTGS